jgi:hypothetical protein
MERLISSMIVCWKAAFAIIAYLLSAFLSAPLDHELLVIFY